MFCTLLCVSEVNLERKKMREQEKQDFVELCKKGIQIAIDCSFQENMTEKENGSLVQQIMHCYGQVL